jgi:sigma-B regulation protein RsbU (phosphoserine phosphatase)
LFDPKYFYRKLDSLLHEIQSGTATQEWFEWLVREILRGFADELGIASGRLYREERVGFKLERQFQSFDPGVEGLTLPYDYPPLVAALAHGVCVIDPSFEGQDEVLERRLGGLESVAAVIECEPRRLLAFGLSEGSDRERLELAMRTIRNAIHHRLSEVGFEHDIDQVSELQKSLVASRPPIFPGYEIAARSIPTAAVGGDFYDFLPLGAEVLGLALGDSSGHGLPAALVARDVVTGLRMAVERDLKITATIHKLNQVIARSMLSTRFVSLFYGELEHNGNLFYVCAGHPPAIKIGAGGTQLLDIGGIILGPMEDAHFKRGFAHVDRGDVLVLVTDGVLERMSPDGEMLGAAGVERIVTEHLHESADVILDALLSGAEEWGHGRPWVDDTSAIVVKRRNEHARETMTRRGW